ncbi:hypothetical protein DIZ76_016254 [Coccidioides immitis]|nr:hypothetical protein DIZ76_016254 [Coccidioides immitis]
MSIPPNNPREFASQVFDYLIIGGGTAGLVVASRLSEKPHLKIAVIEAGPAVFDEPLINEPELFGEAIGTKYDWQFETEPQPGLAGQRVPWPRGKVLGGSSALNFLVWNRGHKEDYDAWVAMGNQGWGWDDLLPYFKKSETFHEPSLSEQEKNYSYFEASSHGIEGPVKTSHIQRFAPSLKYWHQTLENLGVEVNRQSYSGANAGAWNLISAFDPAAYTRSFSANRYYLPVSQRPNLFLLTEATVEQITLEKHGEEWIAKGALVRYGEEKFIVKASKEVILSAGSIQSPQLLELSGIGNPEILTAAGIPVKVANPNVGENLQDHLLTTFVYEMRTPSNSPDVNLLPPQKVEETSDGPKVEEPSRAFLPGPAAYCPLFRMLTNEELEDITTRICPEILKSTKARETRLRDAFLSGKMLGAIEYIWYGETIWNKAFKGEPGKKYATIVQMLQYPFSRGSVHIPPMRDSRPITVDEKPIIDPQYCVGDGKIDLDVMKVGQMFADKICATEPLSHVIAGRVFPAKADNDDDDADVIDDYLRNNIGTEFHPIGTCAMGGFEGAKAGVVDDKLRVYGVRGLRVVDASIMPLHISAHTQATVYAIAEKAASMVLEDERSE